VNRTLILLLGLQTTTLAAACNGQVDVGNLPGEGGLPSEGGFSDRSLSSSGGSDGETLGNLSDANADTSDVDARTPPADSGAAALSGKYTGYVESFQFPDGSDTVVMNLAFASDGTISGTLEFGSAALLSPPTDPNVGYPPALTTTSPAGLLEGFAFTILGGSYTAPRVQLSIHNNELWKQWCELQTVIYPVGNGVPDPDGGGSCGQVVGYGCLPNGGLMESASGCTVGSCTVPPSSIMVDCGKLLLCGSARACTCTGTSCTVPTPATGPTSFDMQLTSGALNGTVTGLSSQSFNVHLARTP
jgi:hypothetical protein